MADKIIIGLEFESKDPSKALDKNIPELKSAGNRAGKAYTLEFGKSVKSSLASVRSNIVSAAAGFFAFNAASSILRGATSAALGFEKAILEVNTILPKNQKLTEAQTNALRALGKEYGTSAQKQVKSFYQIISAGVTDSTKATELLTQANQLAIGGLADVGSSINILTSIVNAYGQENITAKEASDSLFTAVRLGKTTVSELASSLSLAIPAARSAGVGLDVVNAAVATLTANGFETSVAVTRVNGLLTALARNGKELGEGFDVAAVKTDGLVKVLQRLQTRTGGNADELLKLLGRQEAVQAVQTLARNNAQALSDTYAQFNTKLGATSKAFNEISKSSQFKFDQLKAELNDVGLILGNTIIPLILTTVKGFGVIANSFRADKPLTELDKINQKLSEQRKVLNFQITKLEEFKKTQGDFFGASPELIERTNDKIRKQREVVASLISQRAELINKDNELEANASREKEIAGLRNAQDAYAQYQEGIQATNAARKQEIVDQILQVAVLAEARQRELEESTTANSLFAQNTINTFKMVASAFGQTGNFITAQAKQLAGAVFSSLTNGIGRAFQNVGVALANGGNAFQAFADGLKSVLADISSSIGDVFIKWGVANLVSGNVGVGGAQIAAGAALKVLGGALSAGSGGSSSSSSAPTVGSGNAPIAVEDVGATDFQDVSAAQERTNVTLNIQGSVVRESEASNWLTDLLETSGSRDSTIIPSLRTGVA